MTRARERLDERVGERGAVIVLVAIGLVFMLGSCGLGIDGSRMLEERRAAQAAADHAATAAAFISCSGGSYDDSVLAGLAAADRNGFDNDGTTNDVTVVAAGTNTFRAAITSTIEGTFSRLLGFTDFNVSVEATAGGQDCGGGGDGPGAIFAGGTCPEGKWGVDISGSNAEIYGGVHSNSHTSTSGSSNRFYEAGDPRDPFTFVGTHQNGGSGNVFQSPDYPDQVAPRSWPATWTAGDITGAPTGEPAEGTFLAEYYDLAVANGTFSTDKITTIDKHGVYYTTSEDGMDIGSITWDLATSSRSVVLVATRGPIKISVSTAGKEFNSYDHNDLERKGILILSNESFGSDDDRCSKYSINLSGQAATWNGIVWAPGGLIEFAGSDSSALNGSLIGWSVKLGGQYIDIEYDSTLLEADPLILLIR